MLSHRRDERWRVLSCRGRVAADYSRQWHLDGAVSQQVADAGLAAELDELAGQTLDDL